MPYTPQTWINGAAGGTPINAARLGIMETGITNAAATGDDALALVQPLSTAHDEATTGIYSPWTRGAVGDGVTVDQAAIELAISDCVDGGGGMVGPLGVHKMDAELVLSNKVTLFGTHRNASQLIWSTDLGVGKYAIKHPAVPESANPGSIRDLSIIGPGPRTLGVRTVDMDGVRLASQSPMTNVYVEKFGAGLVLPYDHNRLYGVDIRNNYYGVLFPSDWVTKGNHSFFACAMVSNTFASVAVAGNNSMDQVLFDGCHMGFGPYCLYRADMGAASTDSGVTGCMFNLTTFEYVGNAIYLDESTGVAGQGVVSLSNTSFNRCSFTSSDNTTDYRIAARSFDYAFDVRYIADTDWWAGTQPLQVPTGGKGLFKVGICEESFRLHLKFPPAGVGQLGVGCFFMTVDGYGASDAHAYIADGTISTGDLLAWTGTNRLNRMVAGTITKFGGVALNNADTVVANTIVIVSEPGSIVRINSEVVTGGALVYPVAGTEHHVGPVVNGAPVGIATQAGGNAGGTVQVKIRTIAN